MKLPITEGMANWIVRKAKEAPYEHLGNYMKRWWFIVTPWFKARVHEILRSDREFHLHSHPWSFISIILKGGYWELTPVYIKRADGWEYYQKAPTRRSEKVVLQEKGEKEIFWKTWYGPGSVLYRKAGTFHKVILPEGEITTTLFFTGKQKIDWGFLRDGAFVFWREYLNDWRV